MSFIVSAQDDPSEWKRDRPAIPAIEESPRRAEQDMTSLARVLPTGGADLALTHLDNQQIHKLAVISRELEAYRVSPLLAKVPETAIQAHAVADLIKNCASAVAELERSRKNIVTPWNEKVKQINGLYKLLIDPLEQVRAQADKNLLAHNQAERARIQRERDEQERKAREAAEAEALAVAKAQEAKTETERTEALQEAEAASMAIATAQAATVAVAPKAYRSDVGTVGIRKTYKLDAFDPDKIPAEYWRRDAVLEAVRKELARAVRAGARCIEGCVIVEEESTAAR